MSAHQKQFTYLPLHIVKSATNIADLVLPTAARGKMEFLDKVIRQIHKQMPTECRKWLRELDDLRFVESILSEESNSNKNNIREREREREPQPSTSTAMPKSAKKSSHETPQPLSGELRKRKVHLSINFVCHRKFIE